MVRRQGGRIVEDDIVLVRKHMEDAACANPDGMTRQFCQGRNRSDSVDRTCKGLQYSLNIGVRNMVYMGSKGDIHADLHNSVQGSESMSMGHHIALCIIEGYIDSSNGKGIIGY
eukprot:jgi/Psemu1/5106/gm1.5106_g